ncbi:4-hydroxy-2-oxoglutarate aldolase, mitochondrial [Arachnomyces sp. PD_36]|nr:4-hydroxy-2-oxoglutarate aldolase, mitochondrial [Arachnomyces sp. PD_36]
MASAADGKPRTPLRPGVYSPTMTFFDPETEELDIPAIRKHSVRLAKAGLVGLVTMGSNGEAVHLSRAERKLVTQHTRSALDEAGFSNIPVIVGASEQSIRGTVELCKESAEAGGEYVLLVPPSYYRAAMGNEEALYEYFTGVADGSPLPLILYNYPGAVAGIDMDSDFIIRVSQHPNIVGTKFTCGNTGKLTRVARAMKNTITPKSPYPETANASSDAAPYVAFGGMADFTLQTLMSGGSAIIAGGANVLPRVCVRIFDLWSNGQVAEAIELQKVLSTGDWVLTKAAIPGTKGAIQSYYGYGGYPRRPLKRLSAEQTKAVEEGIREVMEVENSLKDVA